MVRTATAALVLLALLIGTVLADPRRALLSLDTPVNSDGNATTNAVDASVVIGTPVPHAIVPVPYCNSKVAVVDGQDYCLAVWSYENSNNVTVILDSSYSFFEPAPLSPSLPSSFIAGGEVHGVAALWVCSAHKDIHITWVVKTPVIGAQVSSIVLQAPIHRLFSRVCSGEILSWVSQSAVEEQLAVATSAPPQQQA